MKFKSFLSALDLDWFRDLMRSACRSRRSKRTTAKAHSRRCFLETLEERVVPANTYTVTLATDLVATTGQEDPSNNPLEGDLRYTIAQANEPVNAGSTIVFSNALSGKTIALNHGELQIAQNTTINGLGAGNLTVSGNTVSRVFNVTSQQAIVTIAGLTVTNGNANPANDGIQGNQGGDIFNSGLLLTLTNDVVTNGRAISSGVGGIDGRGGGIFNATGASLTLGNTTVTTNTAQGFFSGQGQGGGIYGDTSETVTLLSGTMILNNSALGGPGLNGGTGFSPGGTTGANGGNGSGGNVGGAAQGGGVYIAGILAGFDGVQFSNNLAQGGLGGTGGTGGTGAPNSGGVGGNGGRGGRGGDGGDAAGGGVYNTTADISMSNSQFTGNQAISGAGGAGGIGGNAGTGSATTGGTGGNGGRGGVSGDAEGGGVFNSAGDSSVSTSQFTTNQAISGVGGAGGLGGVGAAGSVGGDGGNGGASSFSGVAEGGGVFNSAGNLIISASQFTQNLASSGTGGAGGSGGAAGTGSGGAGGNGGIGNTGNISGVAEGGGAYNSGGNVSVSNSSFTGNQAFSGGSGAGGFGGRGGDGTTAGGDGGDGGASSIAGTAAGGAVFNSGGNITVNSSPFMQNQVVGGAGGVGGLGGNGGNASANPSVGGDGGQGGAGGIGGLAEGGALYNSGLFFTVGSSSFTQNLASSGAGGTGGAGGNAGTGVTFFGDSGDGGIGLTAGMAGGGAIYNQGMDLTVTGSTFTVNEAMTGPGGNGGAGGTAFFPGDGGDAGSSSTAFGGAIAVTTANLFVGSSTFGGTAGLGNIVLGGVGGVGGTGLSNGNGNNGGDAYGGGISASVLTGNVTIGGTAAANILFAGNTVTSGAGGTGANGGNGGLASGGGLSYYLAPGSSTTTTATAISITYTAFNSDTVTSGAGGSATFIAGSATIGSGGGFAVDNEVAKTTVTLSNSTITANQVVGGMGGAAQVDDGGAGGAVTGAGVAFIMGPAGSSGTNDLQITDSHIDNNLGTGGLGGSSILGNGPGGPGGSGGNAQGGGVYFYNASNGTSSFTFVDSSASSNQLTGGRGGVGGNAGPSGLNNVPGGPGGVGGQALGGGIFLWTQPQGTNTSTISYAILDTNVLNGGVGGAGGQGAVANGGDGGQAAGGGVYNDGSDTTTLGLLTITGTTVAGNIVTAGAGGIAGSGTTPNGGNGGRGGNGGSAMGGGIYNNDATLMVTNTTIGSLPNVFRNILTAGNGGRGGNAGTAGNTLPSANGGNGGNGGNAQGGGVFINGGSATFINDTIIDNQVTHSLTTGAGGAPGDAAGNGSGTNGMPGADGTANGGGYFAAAGTNSFGNTILDLNSAVTSGPDIDGNNTATITSLGNNILGTGDNAFSPVSSDSLGVSSMSLNLGPLQNNGGPTPTSALLRGSVAIDAGNNALVPSSDSFDQRGAGFPRIFNGTVDVGAFEFEAPSLVSVSPASVPEGSGSVTLTLTGGDFQSGVTTVTVSGSASATWAPTFNLLANVQSGTQLTINLPANEVQQDGPLTITIEIPDGSGLSGPTHVLTSNSIAFNITTPPVRALNYGPQNNLEGDVVLLGDPSNDPNLNDWQIAAGSLPSGLSIDSNTGVISGTIASNAAGTYTVTVSANDDGTTDTGTFTWTVGPLINSLSQTSAVEGSNSFTLTITGADFTVGSSTVHIIGSASAAVPSIALTPLAGSTSTQLFVNVPTSILQQDGPLTINVAVPGSSGTVVSNSETFIITTPPFRAIPYPSVINNNEGDTVSLANPGDPNLINWTITGLPPGLTFNTTTGLISGTIATDGAGTYTVNVSANDDGTTDTATFTWNVAIVNQPPTFTVVGNGNETVTLDSGPNPQPYSFPGWATNIGPGAADEGSQSVMVNMVSNSNPGLFTSQPILTLNGSAYPQTATLSFTTAPFASGSATITINFQDNGGTANGGHDTSANYTFVIFVTPINQAPSFSDSGNVSATIDNGNNPVPYSIANWATNISPGPSVESWQSVTFNLTNSNPSLFTATGQPTVSPNGTLTFTTVPFATGTATVTATLFDNGGTANGGSDSFALPPFVINVTPINQAPTFNTLGNVAVPIDDAGTPQSNTVANWAFNVEPASPGVTGENGQTVNFIVTNNNPGLFTSNGQPTIVLNGTAPNYPLTGNLVYTLTPLASGTATVTVTLVDNGGTANGGQNTSATYTFTISVNPGIVSGTADQVWIAQVYRDLLAREINAGQPNEVFYWTNQLDNGTTRLQVGEQVANSDGHYTAYVQSLFQSYLGISADQNALNFYLGLYHQGATDQQVQAEILQSSAYYTKNGGTNFGFLSGVYRDVLGQTLDQTGLSFWGTQLAQGVSRYNVALGIVSSVGAETRVIQTSYQKLLGQAADPGSVAFWLSQFAGGATYEDMQANLVASPQYGILSTAKFYNSTPDVNWLNQVFQDTLGRPIDSTGIGYYVLQIRAGARRPDIVASILSSQEYRSDEVAAAFQSILQRPADPGSVSYFVNFLNQGDTIEQVKALLFASSEFFNVESGGNNQGFLQALYADVLGAPVDQQGLAIYGGQLAAGETSPNIIMAPNADPVRESVALSVLTSGSAYQKLVAAAYLKYLRRPVDSGGLGYWSALLSQGMTDEAFYGNLLASPEYYARFSS